jgi:TRAP-type C4-dicarboxylate transport system permease small subunit
VDTPVTGIPETDETPRKMTRPGGIDTLLRIVHKASLSAQVIAGLTLAFMMLVTLSDVILRAFGKPILGAYEIISFSGGIVIGLAIPYTSWMKGHIYVDVLVDRRPRRKGDPIGWKDIVNIITRCVGIALFFFIGWSFFGYAGSLYASKEVSQTLRIPFYPVAYGLGVSCYIQSLLLGCDILKIVGGENE